MHWSRTNNKRRWSTNKKLSTCIWTSYRDQTSHRKIYNYFEIF